MSRRHALHAALAIALLGAPLLAAPAQDDPAARAGAAVRPAPVLELDWEQLLPADERATYSGPPPPVHDYLGEGGPAARQPMSFKVNAELEGRSVRIPGFIVPLDVGQEGRVSEFFLVPYFGACIHVPPPPPNQIVHVRVPQGIVLDSIYEAYWVTGRMQIRNKTTRLGAAAYAITADEVELYEF